MKNARSPASGPLTGDGVVFGTLPYIAPEQAEGRQVGEQADIWSICVVFYETVTGRLPFEGESLGEMLVAIQTEPPVPMSDFAGDDDLWAIIARGLKKPLDERWPHARALGRALATWAIQRGVTTDATGASLEHHWLGRGSADFDPAPRPRIAPGAIAARPSRRACSISQTQLLLLGAPQAEIRARARVRRAAVKPPLWLLP